MSGGGHTPQKSDLMVDALNVWQETGLTPRQLADELKKIKEVSAATFSSYFDNVRNLTSQRNKLLEALKEMHRAFLEHGENDLNDIPVDKAVNMMQAAIAEGSAA